MKKICGRCPKTQSRIARHSQYFLPIFVIVAALLLSAIGAMAPSGSGLKLIGVSVREAYALDPPICIPPGNRCLQNCEIGKWCCKQTGQCIEPSNTTCDYTDCKNENCNVVNVCKVAPLVPTFNPAQCEAGSHCATYCAGQWCCKQDGACFDPGDPKNALCAGSCWKNGCTVDNVCQNTRAIPTTCTQEQLDKGCNTCKDGQRCCGKDGKCIEDSNATCDGTACSGANCNTNAGNLCLKPSDGPPGKCLSGKCLECKVGEYCCMATGQCFADKDTCGFTGCSQGGNCNASQYCKVEALTCPDAGTGSHKLTFVNNATEDIWLAAIPSCWNYGTECHPVPAPGGWHLKAKTSTAIDQVTITFPPCWSGGVIFRTNCKFDPPDASGQASCPTSEQPCCKQGDCAKKPNDNVSAFLCDTGGRPPVSRIEMTFDGGKDGAGKKIQSLTDTYDISYVDGWNKLITIQPTGTKNWPDTGPDPSKQDYWCKTAGCDNTQAPECPKELQLQQLSSSRTYCWSPKSFVMDLYGGGIKGDVVKIEDLGITVDNKLRSKLGCVCHAKAFKGDTRLDIACPSGEACTQTETYYCPRLNPDCADGNTATGEAWHDNYGCSPYSDPGKHNLLSQCCPWLKSESMSCGWDDAQQGRAWPDWARKYILNIKASCMRAYTWQYDDLQSTFTCAGVNFASPVNYRIDIYDEKQ